MTQRRCNNPHFPFPDDDPPQKLKSAQSGNKQIVASFISKTGYAATIPLVEQNTVTASWYLNICMPQVIEKWSILHPKAYPTSLQWHHNNASAHKAALTMDFFAENGIKLIPHPAYSPDLLPSDFLFPKLKRRSKGFISIVQKRQDWLIMRPSKT
ncbi:hypothetical protein LOD99_6215 [Oopsacas minuta]|uniref:Transposase n=1 Tax=Oopsacas minuta TaxID=111878 RepID=A0AAV7JMT2_9METZ|nr:hypothetical protein LOD99_6215 [Oopsacas minuta]